jgi:hypothetical protein
MLVTKSNLPSGATNATSLTHLLLAAALAVSLGACADKESPAPAASQVPIDTSAAQPSVQSEDVVGRGERAPGNDHVPSIRPYKPDHTEVGNYEGPSKLLEVPQGPEGFPIPADAKFTTTHPYYFRGKKEFEKPVHGWQRLELGLNTESLETQEALNFFLTNLHERSWDLRYLPTSQRTSGYLGQEASIDATPPVASKFESVVIQIFNADENDFPTGITIYFNKPGYCGSHAEFSPYCPRDW